MEMTTNASADVVPSSVATNTPPDDVSSFITATTSVKFFLPSPHYDSESDDCMKVPLLGLRQCERFVPQKRDADTCFCGRPKPMHRHLKNEETAWNYKSHTSIVRQNVMGHLVFNQKFLPEKKDFDAGAVATSEINSGTGTPILSDFSTTSCMGASNISHLTCPIDDKDDAAMPPPAKVFARIALPTPEAQAVTFERIHDLMMTHWGLTMPDMILSFVGGQKDVRLDASMDDAFRAGLINLIKRKSNLWMFSGGTHTGVSKIVGKAFRTINVGKLVDDDMMRNINCIGVAPWGFIQHNDKMEEHFTTNFHREAAAAASKKHERPSQQQWSHPLPPPFHYDSESREVREKARRVGGKVPLDPDHTHFFLIDDGSFNKYGYEHLFRADLEQYLAEKIGSENVAVPHITILIEGGKDAIEFVLKSLENGTPVVVMNGSGRVSNRLAASWKRVVHELDEVEYENGNVPIEDIIASAVADKKSNFDDVIVKCLRYWDSISVFDLQTSSKLHNDALDVAIYDAYLAKIIKKNISSKKDLLQYFKHAFHWGKVYHAKILIEESKAENPRNFMSLWSNCFIKYFEKALKENKPDFVQMLMEFDHYLKDKVTLNMLRRLYKVYSKREQKRMKYQGRQKGLRNLQRMHGGVDDADTDTDDDDDDDDEDDDDDDDDDDDADTDADTKTDIDIDIDSILKNVLGDFYSSHFVESNRSRSKWFSSGCCRSGGPDHEMKRDDRTDYPSPHPYPDIFIWALLMEYDDIADLFLTHTKYPIAACLAACNYFGRAKNSAENQRKVDVLEKKYAKYEECAISLLSLCYEENAHRTQLLLIQQVEAYGNTSCLKLAVEGKCLNFMGHAACQNHLNNIWHGHISPENSFLILVLCMFVPFLSPFLVSFQMGVNNNDFRTVCKTPAWAELTRLGIQIGRRRRRNYSQLVYEFYKSPILKMYCHLLTYIIFLVVFSSLLIITPAHRTPKDFVDHRPGGMEIFVCLYWLSVIVSEMAQILGYAGKSLLSSIPLHFSQSKWNIFDLFIIVTICIAVILRFSCLSLGPVQCREAYYLNEIVELVYVFLFMLFCVRMLPIFYNVPKLGPMLFMIYGMFSILIRFLLLLLVFMVTFGVAYYVLVFQATHERRDNAFAVFFEILLHPYWGLFGELALEDIQNMRDRADNQTKEDTSFYLHQATTHFILPFFQASYMLVANILLLNLLIALFSFSINKVEEKAQQLWTFSRHDLILEYHARPILPQPFSLLMHVVWGVKWLFHYKSSRMRALEGKKIVCRSTFMAILKNLKGGDQVWKMLRRWEKTIVNSHFMSKAAEEELTNSEKLTRPKFKMIFGTEYPRSPSWVGEGQIGRKLSSLKHQNL